MLKNKPYKILYCRLEILCKKFTKYRQYTLVLYLSLVFA